MSICGALRGLAYLAQQAVAASRKPSTDGLYTAPRLGLNFIGTGPSRVSIPCPNCRCLLQIDTRYYQSSAAPGAPPSPDAADAPSPESDGAPTYTVVVDPFTWAEVDGRASGPNK